MSSFKSPGSAASKQPAGKVPAGDGTRPFNNTGFVSPPAASSQTRTHRVEPLASTGPRHTPVITPSDKPEHDVPPRIGPKPLPPV